MPHQRTVRDGSCPQTVEELLRTSPWSGTSEDGGPVVCTICTEPCLPDGERTIELWCGHVFGDECITRWLIEHNTCPYCREISLDRVMPDGIHEDSDETDDVIDQEDPDEADEEMDEDDIDEDDIAIMEKDLRSQTDLMIEMQQKLLDELRRKERARRERLGIATGEDLTDMDQYLELSFSYDLGLSPSPSDPDEPLIARYERLNEIVLEQASILTGWFRQVESMEEKDRQEEAERATNQTSAVDSVHETPQ